MNILLINGGQKFGHSAGQLNRTLHDIALAHLATLGHQVKETQIEEGYDINEEIETMDVLVMIQANNMVAGDCCKVSNI